MATIKTIITPNDIRSFAPGVEATINEAEIRPYIHSAHKTIASIAGVDVFNEIAASGSEELQNHLKTAVSNRLMYDYKVFETIAKRQVQKLDTYKYELEAMQQTYLSLSFDALDSLFAALAENPHQIKSWASSKTCEALQALFIPTTDEFNSYYGIDGSDYFFFATIFLQRSTVDKHLRGLSLGKLEDAELRRAKSIAATLTVAYALRQFDITMLPKSLRNSASDGASRSAATEQEAMYKLSDYLFVSAEKDLQQLVFDLSNSDVPNDVLPAENLNREDSKFYFVS